MKHLGWWKIISIIDNNNGMGWTCYVDIYCCDGRFVCVSPAGVFEVPDLYVAGEVAKLMAEEHEGRHHIIGQLPPTRQARRARSAESFL